ncbi:hypothetical protein GGI59_006343 [Rhizobium lentis]|uniref:Uncharacterized protein n=1 Tax=Rhizobium lentis TaxID=1138194 RepID=A0A7W8XKW9_9HYPH|nr:hypothetical protein [Rhizobium lentis]MBB5554007.1 hypothetical protein [Rhizobium lentis]MBB5564634.1 hypothetical protein [Rhizobium lentis]MBB5571120.1 hypothetical protein [Rhizobium lentis]
MGSRRQRLTYRCVFSKAGKIGTQSRDLQIMLRRAALLVRNAGSITLDDDPEEALRNVSSDLVLTRNDTIRFIAGVDGEEHLSAGAQPR